MIKNHFIFFSHKMKANDCLEFKKEIQRSFIQFLKEETNCDKILRLSLICMKTKIMKNIGIISMKN